MKYMGRLISAIAMISVLLWNHAIASEANDLRLAALLPEESPRGEAVDLVGDFVVPSLSLEILDSKTMESVATHISQYNLRLISRTDSLYNAGYFGAIDSDLTIQEAARYIKYLSLSSIDFISYLSAQSDVIWETNEREMAGFYHQFVNPGIYPIWGLTRARMGGGAFCLEFDIDSSLKEKRMLGLRQVKLESYTVDAGFVDPVNAWPLEMPTLEHGTTRYLFCDRYSSRVRRSIVEENGVALEVLVLDTIEGLYVEKRGLHKCTGMVFWRSLISEELWPPEASHLGAAAYFPGLKLTIPFLPDIGLYDLREFSAFQPLLSVETCQSDNLPDWLGLTDVGLIEGWGNEGAIPEVIKSLFPDQ